MGWAIARAFARNARWPVSSLCPFGRQRTFRRESASETISPETAPKFNLLTAPRPASSDEANAISRFIQQIQHEVTCETPSEHPS